MRLIDADELIKKWDNKDPRDEEFIGTIKQIILNAPTITPQEQKIKK